MISADRTWVAIAAIVIGHNVTTRDEMLSEAVDRWLITHPVLTRVGVAAVALHLCNTIPSCLDPLHGLFLTARWTRQRLGAKAGGCHVSR